MFLLKDKILALILVRQTFLEERYPLPKDTHGNIMMVWGTPNQIIKLTHDSWEVPFRSNYEFAECTDLNCLLDHNRNLRFANIREGLCLEIIIQNESKINKMLLWQN